MFAESQRIGAGSRSLLLPVCGVGWPSIELFVLFLALGKLASFAFAESAIRFRDVRISPAQNLRRLLVIRAILAVVYKEDCSSLVSEQFLDRRPQPHPRTTRILQVERYFVLHTETA